MEADRNEDSFQHRINDAYRLTNNECGRSNGNAKYNNNNRESRMMPTRTKYAKQSNTLVAAAYTSTLQGDTYSVGSLRKS
jgi:hypothetical protein